MRELRPGEVLIAEGVHLAIESPHESPLGVQGGVSLSAVLGLGLWFGQCSGEG